GPTSAGRSPRRAAREWGRRSADSAAPARARSCGGTVHLRVARGARKRRRAGAPTPANVGSRAYGATTCSSTGALATEPCARSDTITRTGNEPGTGIRIVRRFENTPSPATASPRRPLSFSLAIAWKPFPLSIWAVIRVRRPTPATRAVIVTISLPAGAVSGETDRSDTAADPSANTGKESRTGSET